MGGIDGGMKVRERNSGNKWTALVHNAVIFPPEYETHGIPILYNGKAVELSAESEEIATFMLQSSKLTTCRNLRFSETSSTTSAILYVRPVPIVSLGSLNSVTSLVSMPIWRKRSRRRKIFQPQRERRFARRKRCDARNIQ